MILESSGSFRFVPVCLCMATSIGQQKILFVSLVIMKTGFCFVLKCCFQCMAQLSVFVRHKQLDVDCMLSKNLSSLLTGIY